MLELSIKIALAQSLSEVEARLAKLVSKVLQGCERASVCSRDGAG
ncbi:MAG: hypothetical protein N3E45_14595 [Oscillatoriaceae bacterium SKW80]|nr:hypothetical protein [Oscillatoriaceae bacterium SKYG93]MCX8122026.1 hypothetical protein [Oscillatoriaceae bacterium SKW80]MDW8454313.1 hypothetical protein [Oscillatoriaceae cyanobacterium SKYGB_i_bin93]